MAGGGLGWVGPRLSPSLSPGVYFLLCLQSIHADTYAVVYNTLRYFVSSIFYDSRVRTSQWFMYQMTDDLFYIHIVYMHLFILLHTTYYCRVNQQQLDM